MAAAAGGADVQPERVCALRETKVLPPSSALRKWLRYVLTAERGGQSRWHNRKHARRGTIWEEKFGSVVVEEEERALRTMACLPGRQIEEL